MTEPHSEPLRIANSDDLLALVREVNTRQQRAQEFKRLSGMYRRKARHEQQALAQLREDAARKGITIPHSTQPQEAESP